MLHELLRRAARLWPDEPAIDTGDDCIAYGELERRSDQVAAALVRHGCERGDRVAILCERGIEAYVGVYGVLKAGCAYVPLDRRAPPVRLGYIVDNCAVKAMVISSATAPLAAKLATVGKAVKFAVSASAKPANFSCLPLVDAGSQDVAGHRLRRDVIDTDLAYILYTSGSTGAPKGVMISHLNSMSFVRWASEHSGIKAGERISGHAPMHFDLSIFDIFATARVGGVLVPVPDGISTFPSRLSGWIRDRGINVWYSVPSALTLMAQQPGFEDVDFPELRLVIFAGEVFPARFLNMWIGKLPEVTFMNWYGPTETNVITSHTVLPGKSVDRPVPIGMPCTNVDAFHVDESGNRITESGQEGELLARGSFVALGYWGDVAKTRRSFRFDETLQDRTYRTGDIVKRTDNGEYEYVGRRDHMVKSRGYRIELGEIEAALYRVAGVLEAAVVPVPDEVYGNLLTAFVVAEIADAERNWTRRIMSELAEWVPAYMMPVDVRLANELPKTSTGKIDRQGLKELLHGAGGSGNGAGRLGHNS